MSGTHDLFGIDNDPKVVAARKEWKRRFAANQNARPGNKLVRLGRLQAATEQLMRAELAARRKLKKESRYGDKSTN